MRAAPRAPAVPVRDIYFGVAVDDPYRWMERESDEFDAWLDGQARYARQVLGALPGRDDLRAELRALRAAAGVRRHHVAVAGERAFSLREDPQAGTPVLVVTGTGTRTRAGAGPRTGTGSGSGSGTAERTLLDPNPVRGPLAGPHRALDWYVPSPDGRYVACGISAGGSERSALRVVDVDSGELLPDAIDGVWFGFVSWLDDGKSLVYHRFVDPPPGGPAHARRLDSRSLRHRLGQDPAADDVVLARGLNPRVPLEPSDRPFVYSPAGSGWMVAVVSHGALRPGRVDEALSSCTLYVAPRAGLRRPADCPWRMVAGPAEGVSALALGSDTLYLVAHSGAPRGQVLAVRLADRRRSVLVAQGQRVIEAVRTVGEQLLVRELDGGVARLRRVPAAGGVPEEVDLPIDGTIGEWTTLPDSAGLLLDLESCTSLPRRYRYDAGSGTVTGDPDDAGSGAGHTGGGDSGLFAGITAYRVLAPARDGTSIPISLIHRDGLVRDGTAPVWLEGYGSHGVPLTPEHEPPRLAWLGRGGIWAIAHLRGGGEYGRGWHEAGRLSAKENTITDFIDCAEHLIARGYTRAGRLVGAGRSAGGIPVAGALVRRPDLWAAMILRVPVVNSLRIEFAENGRLHTPEYGTVGTEDGLRSLLISDACHRVRDGIAYPPVLLTAGRNDSRVPPWQPGKLAARLQAAEENGGGPALLRVDEQAGHGFGSTTEQQDEELADAFAFALAAISGRLGRVAAANG